MAGWGSVLRGADDAAGIRRYLAEQAEIQRRLAEGAELARGSTFARRAAAANANLTPLEQLSMSMPDPAPVEPLIDQLNRARRSRDLVNARLDRLTPEQQQSSLGMVARAAEENLAQMRANEIARDAANEELASGVAAALGLGAGIAGGAQMLSLPADRRASMAPAIPAPAPFVRPPVRVPDDTDFTEIQPMDIGEDDILPGVEVPLPEATLPLYQEAVEEPDYSFKTDDALLVDEQRPGPDSEVAGYEDYAPPENAAVLRTIEALVRAGIPRDRAMGIAKGRNSMTPQEYRAVTGSRR
jgi:hypothetical protein